MTDNEQNNYADMLAMLDRIRLMIEHGEDVNGTGGLYDEMVDLLSRVRGED